MNTKYTKLTPEDELLIVLKYGDPYKTVWYDWLERLPKDFILAYNVTIGASIRPCWMFEHRDKHGWESLCILIKQMLIEHESRR